MLNPAKGQKIYQGFREGGPSTPTLVTVREHGKPTHALVHVVVHSPSGLEWGFAGSGPSDLALSILTDHFGEDPEEVQASRRVSWAKPTKAGELHQPFKSAFVARWGDRWALTSGEIGTWLTSLGAADGLRRYAARKAQYDERVAEEARYAEQEGIRYE